MAIRGLQLQVLAEPVVFLSKGVSCVAPLAAHARIQVGGDRVFYWTPHTSKRWGNVLSPYWQARALALLAGHVSEQRFRDG